MTSIPRDCVCEQPQLSCDGWLADLYHENTKLDCATMEDTERRIISACCDLDSLRPCPATQPNLPRVKLPHRRWDWGLDRLIRRRRTTREFSGAPLDLGLLGRILFNASGVTGTGTQAAPWPLRATPSAGALYPLELRLAVLNVAGIAAGIYRYHPYEHCVEMISSHIRKDDLARASLHPSLVADSAVVIGFFADWQRTILKYGDRGYRYVLLEAGHMAQNILLTSTSANIAAVPVGGFLDAPLTKQFDAEPGEQLLYLILLSRPA